MNIIHEQYIDREVHLHELGYPDPAFRVVVAGSRGFQDYDLMQRKLNAFLRVRLNAEIPVQIVSGTAGGADTLGERYADNIGLEVCRFPAPWEELGKPAGYVRNRLMARVSDAVVVFWDGQSRGSQHMIRIAEEMGRPLRVVMTH